MSDLIHHQEERICSNCGSNSTPFTKEGYPRWYRSECTDADLFTCHSCYNAQYYRNNKNNGHWLTKKPADPPEKPSSLAPEPTSDRDYGK
jgi:hypothetical protein